MDATAMTTDILVPTLGESVSEATVARWLKQVGDPVKADEPLVELETDKVTLEVGAAEAGVVAEVLAGEGENVEVGAVLGRITPRDGGRAEAPPAAEPAPPPAPAPVAQGGEPIELVVPTLGESVSEASVGQWLKTLGDLVKADQPLVELETDKVTLEVGAPAAGVLKEIRAAVGDTVEVGAVLGVVLAGAEASAPAPTEAVEAATEVAPKAAPVAAPVAGPAHGELSPAVRKMIAEAGVDPAQIPGTGRDGRITKQDVQAYLAGGTTPAVAPPGAAALDPSRAAHSGPDGRITRQDVLAFLGAPEPGRPAAPSGRVSAPGAGGPRPREERVRMTKLRQTVARRLKQAQNTAAMLTTFNEADMGAVMALRAQHKEAFEKKHGVKLGFMSFFTKAVVAALKELPAVNARIEDDELVYLHEYHVGMAVSTPAGLMVPVVRDCDHKSFAEIERDLAELAGKGRDGKLAMDELTGGTFTITNGGVFGSLMSTPILNMPQSGILGLHKIQERPMAVNGEVQVRPMMYLALSYDHRIIDGREAVTFLVRVKAFIEDPERLLLDI
jgi:2-oxoglutarate dehydrogenase E2 component (dihydrolipoamide succinyltransferase)